MSAKKIVEDTIEKNPKNSFRSVEIVLELQTMFGALRSLKPRCVRFMLPDFIFTNLKVVKILVLLFFRYFQKCLMNFS